MVESAGLENWCAVLKPYRGFESLPLRRTTPSRRKVNRETIFGLVISGAKRTHQHTMTLVYKNIVLSTVIAITTAVLCMSMATPSVDATENQPNENKSTAIVFSGMLSMEDRGSNGLLFDADTSAGSLLYDNRLTISNKTFTIKQMRATKSRFYIHLKQDDNEVSESEVLSDHFIVLKRGFTIIGYIAADMLTSESPDSHEESIRFSDSNNLNRYDFMYRTRFEITSKEPADVNRFPVEKYPLRNITRSRTDGPAVIRLSEHFVDPEGEKITATVRIIGECCIADATTSGDLLMIKPIAVGTVTAEIRVFDPAGNRTTKKVPITITAGDSSKTVDHTAPRLVSVTAKRAVSEEPKVVITVDHQQAAKENIKSIFSGSTSCNQLTSNDIKGTSVGGRETSPIYTGVLTGGVKKEGVDTLQGYSEVKQIGKLTPNSIEKNRVVYTINEIVVHTHGNEESTLEVQITPEQQQQKEHIQFSQYHLNFKNKDNTLIGSVPLADTQWQEGAYRTTVNTATENKQWLAEDAYTTVEIARARADEPANLFPQIYTITIAGPAGEYSGCSITIQDDTGNTSQNTTALPTITITKDTQEEVGNKEVQYQIWSKTKEQKDILQMGKAAIVLSRSGGDTSGDNQDTPIKRRSSAPEVYDLQVFLNISGYTITTEGIGSRGEEIAYFGPATQHALESFQRENGIQATGEVDAPTKTAILLFTIKKFEELISST